ncbi:MAG: sensor histidine kinase [bacterium]|nr:sensor histidine kinase [bacterium]
MADDFHPALPSGPELAFALIESSQAAALLLDETFVVVAASTSFLKAFKLELKSVVGQEVFNLGAGEWAVPQLRSLLKATASGAAKIEAYEMDLKVRQGPARRLVLHAQKLEYGLADAPPRLLLTVTDVTAARGMEMLKDQLLEEKAIALQAVQHRVANSLQIIASVILQSARHVRSEETRGRLRDVHNRVMSVAALQTQLATSQVGDVALRAYFTQLCDSLGASMIADHDKIILRVDVDDSTVDANVSVSLGLMVTELVINCLKHAFPHGRNGEITVAYRQDGANWRLCVRDNGVGMITGPGGPKAGLGTSIVQALAKQLKSVVEVVDNAPGVKVSIVHETADRVASPAAV